MEKTYNIVYLTTNKLNGKKYIGDHSTFNLEDGYLGSGNLIVLAIKKYGKDNFERIILEKFSNKTEAYYAQEIYINELNTLVPNGYNLSPKGGMGSSGCWNEESLAKMKISLSKKLTGRKLSPSHIEKIKERAKLRIGELNAMYNKTVYDTWVKNYSIEEADLRFNEMKLKMTKTRTGKIFTSEHCENISKGRKGQTFQKVECPHCKKTISPGNFGRWHGDNCKERIYN